jgi:hypothetical protein
MFAAFAIAIAIATWFFCDRVEAQSAGTIYAPSPPATSATDAVSIRNRSWSGEIDDARGGRGLITIRFSSDVGTFVASFCCNMSNTGTIINFAQTSDQHATFVLHSSLWVGCDYSVTSYAADGHLKGSYQGCRNNSGSFDLVSSPAPQNVAQNQRIADVPVAQAEPPSTPSPRPEATYAQAKPAKLRSDSASKRLCILTGTVKTKAGVSIKNARAVLTSSLAEPWFTSTDSSGEYELIVASGEYKIEMQAPGYTSAQSAISLFQASDGRCKQVLNVALRTGPPPTPRPTFEPDRIAEAVQASISAYCKKAAQIACSLYMGHAYECVSVALDAKRIYGVILIFKQQGFSSGQAVKAAGGSEVAEDAAEMIDGMSMKVAASPKWPEIFARTVILPACLASGR